MPSERYYWHQAMALLSWAQATGDKAWADSCASARPRELARAGEDKGAISDLNSVLDDFNDQQMRKS